MLSQVDHVVHEDDLVVAVNSNLVGNDAVFQGPFGERRVRLKSGLTKYKSSLIVHKSECQLMTPLKDC
jgi:hypothetical protein